jgi:hypothetical protein
VTTWLIFRDEQAYRDAVALCATVPLDLGDARALGKQARCVTEQHEGSRIEVDNCYAIALGAALEAVKAARRNHKPRPAIRRPFGLAGHKRFP